MSVNVCSSKQEEESRHQKNPLFRKKIKLFISTYGFDTEKDHLGCSFLVFENGEKYLWASPKNGKRCFTKISQWPDKINWTSTRIVQSSVNDDNILVLTDTGMVYHFGLYCHDLHIDLITRGIDTIDLFPEIKIGACGRFSFIFINNSLMIEGTDRSVNFCELYSITLNLIPFSPKITVKVATGFDHILVLTTEGKVYGWGLNTHGQLNFNRENLPETTQIKSASKIFIPNVNNVSDIAAMKYISAFKSSYDGRIYIQGCLHNLKIKRLAICEYTNIFDRYNSSFHSVEKNRIYTEEDKNILDDLSNAFYTCYFSSEFMSDLTIEVKGEFIYVHKSILKMRSLYFKNMFAFNEVENRKRVIEYDDYPYSTYRKFFKFFYTGWVYSDYINQMIELLILADKFCVTNLEKECIKYLKIHMKPSTVSYIKEMAIKYNKAELEQYCDAYELREAYDPTQIIL